MAEGDGAFYNDFKEKLLNKQHDFTNDTFKLAMWHTTAPDIDVHDTWSDLSGNEVSDGGSNYTAGGEALAGQTVTQDNTNDRAAFDATDVTWSNLLLTTPVDATPDYAALYNDTHASDLLVCYWELGTTATNGGDYTLQFGANGIFTLT